MFISVKTKELEATEKLKAVVQAKQTNNLECREL